MKNTILKFMAIALIALFGTFSFVTAQQLRELPKGPNGGNMFPTNVKNMKVELKMDGNKAVFYIINDQNKNATLTSSAASADVLIDFNAEQPAVTKNVTITSKNKFEITLPDGAIKPNFLAIHANFNGDILDARFIVRDLPQVAAPPAPSVK